MLLAALLLIAQPALAYRPLVTEDPGVNDPGRTELEVGLERSRATGATTDRFELLAKAGLGHRLELGISLPYLLVDSGAGPAVGGPGDAGVGLKWNLREEAGWTPALGMRGDWKAATGDEADGLGSGDYDFGLMGTASWRPARHRVLLMAGYVRTGDAKDPALHDHAVFGIAGDVALGKGWQAVAEIAGGLHQRLGSGHSMIAGIGAYHDLFEHVRFDAAYRRGLNSESPDWSLTLGLTVR